MNVIKNFFDWANQSPSKKAISEVSYGELSDRVKALAAGMKARGIRRGSKVMILIPMSVALYETLLACFHVGATVVFLDSWSDQKRVNLGIQTASPDAFIGTVSAAIFLMLSSAFRTIPIKWIVGKHFLTIRRFERPDLGEPPADLLPDDTALITYTTGSTGTPKAALRSHAFLLAQHAAIVGQFGDYKGKIDMPILPIFVFLNLALGISSILPKKKPKDIYNQIICENIDSSSGSPSFFQSLALWCKVRGLKLPLKRLCIGGAPVFPKLAQLLTDIVEGDVIVVYGSTEAEPISHINTKEMLAIMRSKKTAGICVGKPAGLELRIDSPIDGVGEIVVSGDHVLSTPNWHHTGDAGKLDEEGRLWLFGRINERIFRSGVTWWPAVLERKAQDFPGVVFSACLVIPDDVLGQKIILFLEGTLGSEKENWEKDFRACVSDFPIDEIRLVKHIPRDPRHASKKNIEALKRRFL